MSSERGNILDPLAQGRQPNRHHVEAIEQIFAELTLPDQLAQIPMRRGHDTDISLDRRAPPYRGVFALLKDTQ